MPAALTLLLALQRPRWTDPRVPMPTVWTEPGYLRLVWIQSPNFGPRPPGGPIDTIVVHSTVIPTLERTTVAFQRGEPANPNPVSAHFTVGKDGSVVQNVSTFDRAWHAGGGVDAVGRTNPNNYSVGIELVNLNDGKDPYPDAQIQALRGLVATLRRRFPIRQIVSHEYIAQPAGRKNDPKNFPWDRLKDFGLPIYTGEHRV